RLLRTQASEERQVFIAAPAKRAERFGGVVAQVLALLRPPVRRAGMERRQLRLVHGHDQLEAAREQLLGVAQVADDFLGGPVLSVRAPRQDRVALPAN